mmetsp:Transcript_5362/g.12940  ORF Transcript_5362/g.12940 Transcript_5362/m.12940 type:complete len:320 (-) Transcript_5362:69-1028(-)
MKLPKLVPFCTVALYNVACATQLRPDRQTVDPVALVSGSEEVAQQSEQLANRLDAIADRVDEMLKTDGAPAQLRHEEHTLLHQAELAVQGRQQHIPQRRLAFQHTPRATAKPRRHSVFDRLKRQMHAQPQAKARSHSLPNEITVVQHQADEPKGGLASEVKQAERVIEAGLAADNVPQTVRDKEAQLLDGAASIAQKLDLHADEGMQANMTKMSEALNATAAVGQNSSAASSSASNESSTPTSAQESNATTQDAVFELRKEHQLLLSHNKELRSENTKLRRYTLQEAEKLEEENQELQDSNIKLESENAKLQGELTSEA